MRLHLLLATVLSMVLVGCETAATPCDAPSVRPGIIHSLGEGSAARDLYTDMKLVKPAQVQVDEATKVSDCSARLVIPTEAGPFDYNLRYRVGPSKSGDSVFMYIVADDELLSFVDRLDRYAETLGR
ncbi:hypothetical protein [Pseudomonas sp. DG56-2]|uniref:hypothetical protein n=1 Tax=Pseudomonas sp. DG56-2 TaxID=2320270 RepID=UPI0010A6A5B0|nr:hypothetical protein [Pseudomonas sp. DG56-2]